MSHKQCNGVTDIGFGVTFNNLFCLIFSYLTHISEAFQHNLTIYHTIVFYLKQLQHMRQACIVQRPVRMNINAFDYGVTNNHNGVISKQMSGTGSGFVFNIAGFG